MTGGCHSLRNMENSSIDADGYFGSADEWSKRVAAPFPEYLVSFNNGDCAIEFWKPRAPDTQLPHDRDEVYVIVSGEAVFSLNGARRKVRCGDLIFVPTGVEHCFEEFGDDLAMWIVFFGKRSTGFDASP